jgi:16S rRNA (adenine1518-N6/adenine1519-N6)-dimethyltransferase
VATVQMELARRLMGRPAGPDYGPLAAFLDLRARVTLLRKAGPAIFWPRPKVDSALIEIALKPPGQTPFPLAQSQAFLQFLNRAFRTRRKKIRNIIGLPGGRAAPQGDRRPGELEPRELLDLYRLSTVPLPTSAQGMPSSRSFRLEK